MKHVKLFIWDFDGTLMDTYPFTTACLKRALADYGREVSQVEILEQMMVTIGHAVSYYSKRFDLPLLKERFAFYHAEEGRETPRLMPGVEEVLRAIRDKGCVNAIFTNRGDSTYPMLEKAGILSLFDTIVTANSPHFKVKPAPDSVLWLMKHHGAEPEETVMIGDRACDLESGYGAGCLTCHLLTEAVPQSPKCDYRVERVDQMLSLLD